MPSARTLRNLWALMLLWLGMMFWVQHETSVTKLENERLKRECLCKETD